MKEILNNKYKNFVKSECTYFPSSTKDCLRFQEAFYPSYTSN